jgi:hypothetical protein
MPSAPAIRAKCATKSHSRPPLLPADLPLGYRARQTEAAPVTRPGSRIAFKLPFGEPSVIFEGDKLTATEEGQFVDY